MSDDPPPRRKIVTIESQQTGDPWQRGREQMSPAPPRPPVEVQGEHPTEYVHARERLRRARIYRVSLRPHIGQLLGDAYHVAAAELSALRAKTAAGDPLTPAEAGKFAKVTESVVKLMKEERAQESRSDPAQLSDEQLLQQAEEARQYLQVLTQDSGDED